MKSLDRSPFHCWALHIDPNRPASAPTDAMRMGSLLHTLVLEPGEVASRYIVKPDGMSFASREGKAWRDAVPAGAQIISHTDHATAQAMAKALRSQPLISEVLASGFAESTCIWTDEATGLRCKARPDWIHPTRPGACIALDVKTIDDLTHDSVSKAIARYAYHRQQAHYIAGIEACGLEVREFIFAFVSSSYPHIARAFVLDDDTAAQGADEVAALLARYKACDQLGLWTEVDPGYQLVGLPAWARRTTELEFSHAD
jgi:exodeoxyribonuclease VIII